MHGGVPSDERPELIARFRRGEFDVLLASRVASEGLDFEFCSAVVNYDLPWNPMEVEQRIGRIDRFGQTEDKILILNFHTPGTIETDIVDRVHTRIGVFTDSIGELEPILRRSVGAAPPDDVRLHAHAGAARSPPRRDDGRRSRSSATPSPRSRTPRRSSPRPTRPRSTGWNATSCRAAATSASRSWCCCSRSGWPAPVAHRAGSPTTASGCTSGVRRRSTPTCARCRRSASGRPPSSNELSRALRDEVDVHLCLDQEHAREVGATLLTANHPFVRAALASSGSGAARYASLRLDDPELAPGRYLVTISLVTWSGVRPSAELWTSAVPLDGGREGDDVGRATLAALAEARWDEGVPVTAPIERALQTAMSDIRRSAARRGASDAPRRTSRCWSCAGSACARRSSARRR